MPIYEFQCRKCKAHLEVFQKINDKPPVKCRKCGGRLEKQVSTSAIQFKGSGWYVTDYAADSKNKKEETKESTDTSASSVDKKAEKKTETNVSETKAEKKPEKTEHKQGKTTLESK